MFKRFGSALFFSGLWIGVISSAAAQTTLRIAAFNLGWAGTTQEYERHLQVCRHPQVNDCDTRGDADDPRVIACRAAFTRVAGGVPAAYGVAPCNAYEKFLPRNAGLIAYQDRLQALRDTMLGNAARGIDDPHIDIWAVSEVSGAAVFDEILGTRRADYHVCITRQNEFQKVGFVWRKTLGASPADCMEEPGLAVPDDPAQNSNKDEPRRLRKGMALTLLLGQERVTFMSLHLKSACANPQAEKFAGRSQPARPLTSTEPACRLLRAQVKPLEAWLDRVAATTPRFIMLGDFNRKLHQELGQPARADGEPADALLDPPGRAPSPVLHLYPELNDGVPTAARTWLMKTGARPAGCRGFVGLDHIVLSEALARLGNNRRTLAAKWAVVRTPTGRPASDHCPLWAELSF